MNQKTIMIVDDKPSLMSLFSAQITDLAPCAVQILSYNDAKLALVFLRLPETKDIIIFTDYEMPGMNGVAFITALQDYVAIKSFRIFIMSACEKNYIQEQLQFAQVEHLVQDILKKPEMFKMETMKTFLHKLLR